ncbi:hypothetical protein CpipJ_CPIJ006514 [Culex quinquefasciatus]|uniref:Secreted protein n=1 Tax=Culex quinquefasciatus TaxID=7176 RepID=B0WHL4_CULQU|nr:hypothetical protein CpipJ_CPIJ006514 [Culex quinquefasciatus]|eukprot:XP_001848198.1 hypothetical protein CpipJ_CPIJ006514 [Culex quinquefasciatus]
MKLVVALVLVVVASAVVVSADHPPAAASHDVLQQFPVPSDPARRPVPLATEPGDQNSQENMEGAESRHYHHKGGRKGGKKWGR